MTEHQEISTTLDNYEQAWNRMDFDALAALWQQDEQGIYYVAEEIDKPLRDFDAVLEYWSRTKSTVESVQIATSNRRLKILCDDCCVATYEMHVDASMRGAKQQGYKPLGVDVRVSAILRLGASGWRFIHYVEAPLGALPFVRRAYNANARG